LNVAKLRGYITKRYFSDVARRVSLLLLGPPGIGKSVAVYEAGEDIAKRLGKKFISMRMRWRNGKFVIDTDGEREVHEVLNNPNEYFVLVDIRLSTIAPEDLIGIPRSHQSMSFYEPLAWAVLLSCTDGIAFFDEFTQINRPDVESASYPLILDKLAGFVEFSKGVMVISAGNTPEHSSIAHMISTPLASRFKIVRIEPPRVDDWFEWMNWKHGDGFDKRVYAFLKRFEDENYLIQVPRTPETLDSYPVPRTWEWLALELHEGFSTDDDICGLVGYEVGTKLQAFLKVDVDIEELIRTPEVFTRLDLDGRYMVSVMLGTWISKHINDPKRAYPLIDAMSLESREFLVLTCMSMEKRNLVQFLRQLFTYQPSYKDVLSEIAIKLKEEISGT
jgi:hypothetical protein